MIFKNILLDEPWIKYKYSLINQHLHLVYPDSLIFCLQLVLERLKSLKPVYRKYPDAIKYDISLLQQERWKDSLVVLDKYLNPVIFPKSVTRLEQTYKLIQE